MKSYVLGSLCRRGHDHDGSGRSLRAPSGHCVVCERESKAARRADPAINARSLQVGYEWRRRNLERVRQKERARKSTPEAREALRAKARAAYYRDHEKTLAAVAVRRERNREALRAKQKLAKQKIRKERPDEVRKYAKDYYKRNSLRVRIRNRVYKAIRQQKTNKLFTVAGYGIDIPAIASALGPCPGNHGEWHIDHIRPLASFDLSDPLQVLEAFRPENHQWLPAADNRYKAAKYG